jgi:hypothetical protein
VVRAMGCRRGEMRAFPDFWVAKAEKAVEGKAAVKAIAKSNSAARRLVNRTLEVSLLSDS